MKKYILQKLYIDKSSFETIFDKIIKFRYEFEVIKNIFEKR